MALLEDLEDGDPYAWGIAAFLAFVLLNYYRNTTATGDDQFGSDAPADPAIDSAIDILSPMQISPAGQAFIKKQEGWTAKPVGDAGGQEVGWGHTVRPSDNLSYPIMPSVGETLFQQDVAAAEAIVNSTVTVPLTQNQFDALGDLAYNSGNAAFGANSTLINKLNAGDYAGAAQAFALYNKSQGQVNQGLVDRRGQDQQMFNS